LTLRIFYQISSPALKALKRLIWGLIFDDGMRRSNWLEGTLLLAAYLVLGFAFYFHPVMPVLG
jgi:Ca2+:H+ antiporter